MFIHKLIMIQKQEKRKPLLLKIERRGVDVPQAGFYKRNLINSL